ncbi:hypothetical protein V9T40_004365 [Parthenolecanium corni]|uniref:Uncharacterized protein n=1 Tax=Parthenolecanium corni TaxID=536013 RepID=A0AAN9TUT1_9HEMI
MTPHDVPFPFRSRPTLDGCKGPKGERESSYTVQQRTAGVEEDDDDDDNVVDEGKREEKSNRKGFGGGKRSELRILTDQVEKDTRFAYRFLPLQKPQHTSSNRRILGADFS